ncbi:HYExAFE family protein [Mucisphaera calidilacus]|uniref:Uncharacterized protein n=1 Tax=Mucisphaera calidilacus TaxID=2527982 RepID=A0A518BTC0_9BACT|nr:HYExAFE family protein [Mucisphaera calidilacus]QDU70218.1 hypothetical protein Pan265_00400 [Mucisphaera calidilacus]
MVLRHHPDDCAFEHFLRSAGLPYVAVDEAKRSLCTAPDLADRDRLDALKNFDFVVYSPAGPNLLIDVKGRSAARSIATGAWVSHDDIDSLTRWQALFGTGFQAAFVFLHHWPDVPADGLFREVFEHRGRWYAPALVTLEDFTAAMRIRSARWNTLHLRAADYNRLAHPLARYLSTRN